MRKIFSEVVSDIHSGKILSTKVIDANYQGPIEHCGGGPNPNHGIVTLYENVKFAATAGVVTITIKPDGKPEKVYRFSQKTGEQLP